MVHEETQSSASHRLPDLQNVGAELENDIIWREAEVREIELLLLGGDLIQPGESFDRYRKCLWITLYAHYEGFFKFALTVYATTLNSLDIECHNVNQRLVAWSLDSVFHDLEMKEHKESFFSSRMPDIESVHQIFRRSLLVQEWRQLEGRKLQIPDTAYSTKSNLDYFRLQQLLYQVGFGPTIFESNKDQISHLVIRRHSIAHGNTENRTLGIKGNEYQKIRLVIFKMMSDFAQLILKSLSQKSYLNSQHD